ncbi:MAG: protein kinase [Acidobacteria bacterium]|nr:protein kinase [Acidobacteriota bacterium]
MGEEKNVKVQEYRPTQILHFRIIETLGQGGNGTVFRAFDQKRAEVVALKTLRNPTEVTSSRFKREFFALKNHQHAGIVQVFDEFFDHDPPFFTMEWIKGKTLSQMLDDMERNPLVFNTKDRERFAIRLGIQVCEILEYIHSFEEIHRDLKPDNLFVNLNGTDLLAEFSVKMVDFGLLKQLGENKAHDTQGDMIVGTVHYLSPEQARSQSLDARSDLYSLGVILYRILALRLPHEAPDVVGYLFKTVFENPTPLMDLVPDVDPGLAHLVDRIMAKKMADRPPTAKALKQSLLHLLNPEIPDEVVDLSSEDLFDLFSAPLLVPTFSGHESVLRHLEQSARKLNALRILAIQGQAGSGKSELLRTWRTRVSDPRVTFLSLEFREETFINQDPVGLLVDSLIQSLSRDQVLQLFKDIYPYLTGVSRHLSHFFDARSVGNLEYLPPAKKMQLLAVNAVKLFQRLSERGPVFLILDDIHLAPERFFGWLTLFLEQFEGRQVLTLLTFDGERESVAFSRFRARIEGHLNYWCSNLEPLDEKAMEQFLLSMLPSGQTLKLESKFLKTFRTRTQGNPFCAIELFTRLYDEKHLVYSRGRIGVNDERLLHQPLTMDQALLAKMEQLPEAAANMLRVASIFGTRFPFRWLNQTLGWADEKFHQTIHTLLVGGFLEELSDEEHELRFRVDGFARLIYQHIPEAERTLLHQRIAKTLETQISREDVNGMEILAYHYERCQNLVRTIKYQYLAGCRSLELQDPDKAIALFQKCLKSLEQAHNHYTQNLVHLKMAEVYQMNGQVDLALESYTKVLDLPHLSKIEKYRVHRGRFHCFLERDLIDKAYKEAMEMEELGAQLGTKVRAESWVLVGQATWLHKADGRLWAQNIAKAKTLQPEMEGLPELETLAKLLSNDVVSAAKRIKFLIKNNYQPRFKLLIQFALIRFAAGHLDKALNLLKSNHRDSIDNLPPIIMVLQGLMTYRVRRLLAPDHSADEYLNIALRYVERFELNSYDCWIYLNHAEQLLWERKTEEARNVLAGKPVPNRQFERYWAACLQVQAAFETGTPPENRYLEIFRQIPFDTQTFFPLQVAWLLAKTSESLLPLNLDGPKTLKNLKVAVGLARTLGLNLYLSLLLDAIIRLYEHLKQPEKATECRTELVQLQANLFGDRPPPPFSSETPEHLQVPSTHTL